jgi:hypothetical protein
MSSLANALLARQSKAAQMDGLALNSVSWLQYGSF